MNKLDGETFWMVFALVAVLVILYMAYDFRSSVNGALAAMNYSYCLGEVYGKGNSSNFDIHGSYIGKAVTNGTLDWNTSR